MTTEKQIKANRRNAQRSTGPKTPKGKATVAGNAVKHGLNGRDVVLSSEDGQLLGEMQVEMRLQFQPEGALETFLVKRVAAGIWRLHRLLRVEAALFDEPEAFVFDESKGLGARFRAQTRHGANSFATLYRYESSIDRCLYRALHELQRLQATRMGEDVPPPMALDVLLPAGARQ